MDSTYNSIRSGLNEEEDAASNVAVASPNASRYNFSQMVVESPTSSAVAQELPAMPVQQLSLNQTNLQQFENSTHNGTIPLRTDITPTEATHLHTVQLQVNRSELEDSVTQTNPLESVAEGESVIVHAPQLNDCSSPNHASKFGSESASGSTSRGLAEESSLRRNDKLSVVSLETQFNSPRRATEDALNAENLQLHLRELASGQPLPLHGENMPGRGVIHQERDTLSVMVEPSETDFHSTASSKVRPVTRPVTQTSRSEAVDDLWSNSSTGGDRSHAGDVRANFGVGSNLSKESLHQLRQQLESGTVPLRPEVLAGLGNFVRAMTESERSASMAVEAPTEEASTAVFVPGPAEKPAFDYRHPAPRGELGSPMPIGATSMEMENSPIYPSAPSHQSYGEPEGTEVDPIDDADDEEDDVNEAEADNEGEDDEVIHSTAKSEGVDSSRDIHNDSILTDLEEDDTFEDPRNRSLKRRFTELYRSLADVQYDRDQLGQQLDETNEKVYQLVTSTRKQLAELEQEVLNKLEHLVNSQHSSIQNKLEGALQDLSQRIESHFSHIPTTQEGANSMRRTIGLVMRFEQVNPDASTTAAAATPSSSLDNSASSVREYIVPMAPTATVRQCKIEFLKRLIASKVISDKVKESDTVCLFNTTRLFEDDTLEWILGSDKHVVLTLRVKS